MAPHLEAYSAPFKRLHKQTTKCIQIVDKVEHLKASISILSGLISHDEIYLIQILLVN